MIKKSFFISIACICLQVNAWGMEACVPETTETPLMKAIRKLSKKEKSLSKEFCWALTRCQNERWEWKADETMPKNFKCEDKASENLRCGLTAEEQFSIAAYTGNHYRCLNGYLRQTKIKNPALDYYIETLNNALNRLPNYEGIVVRGGKLPPEVDKLHQVGSVVTYDAFTSASTKKSFFGADVFIIFSKTGKPVMSLSFNKHEFEVLFKSGTRFKILDVMTKDKRKFYIMKEVTCDLGSPQEKIEDTNLLSKIKKVEADEFTPDYWSCPEDKQESLPGSIDQKFLPYMDGYSSEVEN